MNIYLRDIEPNLTLQQAEHIACCIHYFGDGSHPMPEASNVETFGLAYVIECCTEYFSDNELRTEDRDEVILSVLDELNNARKLARRNSNESQTG